ncbi:hypothetical protein [uncultured Ruegeria sp.]|uniref:hypothetical protein n=1 Tax=uncultured Ruegeria sp. TaxID=259304 RepID=UPI002630C1BF|nr:hypothetical protein [uncultured Ruegeria sp.]
MNEGITEVIRSLGRFFTRDILYISAGFLVVFPIGLWSPSMRVEFPSFEGVVALPVAAVLYAIGYAVKELFENRGWSVTGDLPSRTDIENRSWSSRRALNLWRFRKGTNWNRLSGLELNDMLGFFELLTSNERERFARRSFLNHLCSIMGAACIASGVVALFLFLTIIFSNGSPRLELSALVYSIVTISFGLFLLPFSYYHAFARLEYLKLLEPEFEGRKLESKSLSRAAVLSNEKKS